MTIPSAVHPRVCGEQETAYDNQQNQTGSSPRVRGTAIGTLIPFGWPRFIPACAGNSRPGHVRPGLCPVHPRVCGEQALPSLALPSLAGSSPRVRGTGAAEETETNYERFIPACAGNSYLLQRYNLNQPVHPRVCGEQIFPVLLPRCMFGSSPRVRGTASNRFSNRRGTRFIPACAGNRL